MASIKLPRSEHYNRNEARCTGNDWPCSVCGSPIKDHSKARQVRIGLGGGAVISEDDASVGDDGDMGLFPVGPECVRRRPSLKPFLT